MKIMLTYNNDLTVFLSTIFRAIGFKIDYLGRPTQKTIELATKYSPEAWCFDTKLMLGQAIEGAKRGNEILTMPGAWGGKNENCLLGYLCKGVMEKRIEKAVGRKIKLWYFNINPIEMMYSGYFAAYKNIALLRKYSKARFFRTKAIKAFILGVGKMKMAAKLKEKILDSADVAEKEKLFSVYDNFIYDMIYNADTKEDAKKAFEEAAAGILNLRKKKLGKKLVIGIIGDYEHTLLSTFPVLDIEKFLLLQDVFVKQPLSFVNYFSFLSPLYSSRNRKGLEELLPKSVAGSDAVTILCANYLKNRVDGLIHVGTFSCTPEEVADEVLLAHKEKFPPILSLSYDAHTTEENMKVRIEAFVDMLLAHKRRK